MAAGPPLRTLEACARSNRACTATRGATEARSDSGWYPTTARIPFRPRAGCPPESGQCEPWALMPAIKSNPVAPIAGGKSLWQPNSERLRLQPTMSSLRVVRPYTTVLQTQRRTICPAIGRCRGWVLGNADSVGETDQNSIPDSLFLHLHG